MKHKQILALIVVLIVGAGVVLGTPTLRGKPWRLKRGLDLAGGVRVVLQAETDKLPKNVKWSSKHLNSVIRIIRARVDRMGVSEPLIQQKGESQVMVELPEVRNEEQAIKQLQSTARLEFRHFISVKDRRHPAAKYDMDFSRDSQGNEVVTFTDSEGKNVPPSRIIAESPLILTGDDLMPTAVGTKDPQTFESEVSIEFKAPQGRKTFADFTRRNVKEHLAIILEGKILSAPIIQTAILDGKAVIEGSFSPEEAQKLADLLNAGALPVPLHVVHWQKVDATLGSGAVSRSVQAGIVGLVAVILFMVGYYLLPGLIADLSLGIYALLTLALFKLIAVTLTLPGIAAYILSIGMAVDASILIFERLKEELRLGKTLRAAIDTGFKRAFTSIFDSNMCTAITCVILYYYGTGPIKGFALVLLLGVAISMFTAITVTRTILHLIVNTGFAQKPSLFGVGRQWVTGRAGRRYDIVGRMMLWFGISALVILPGLYFWLGAGTLNKGIDFTGGSLMQVEFKQSVRQSQVEEALAGIRLEGSPVQMSGKKVAFIRTKPISETKYTDIKSAMAKLDGEVLAAERVGPTISKELTNNAIKAVLFSALAIVLYLSGRFAIGGLAHGFRFGACAILATLHDVGVVIGVFAMLGYFLKWEIDSLFVTALLTVIGFSTHDTIVIFDRIRENLRHRAKGEAFDGLVNKSILQSFARSINTSLTVVLTLVALLIFGAENIRHFVLALLIGVITGTYSSIFNASQLLVLWQRLVEKQPLAARTAPVQPVTTARARELKPIEAAPGESPNGGAEAEPASPSAPESRAAKTKVKAKKRKRRF